MFTFRVFISRARSRCFGKCFFCVRKSACGVAVFASNSSVLAAGDHWQLGAVYQHWSQALQGWHGQDQVDRIAVVEVGVWRVGANPARQVLVAHMCAMQWCDRSHLTVWMSVWCRCSTALLSRCSNFWRRRS